MTDEQGNDFDVRMSDDTIKNSIFQLIANIVVVENCQGFDSIDDFLITGGKMNDINTYKMMIDGLAYRSGQFYFVAVPAKKGSRSYLQIYFTTEKDAIFRIYHPDISLHRPKDQIVMNYDCFCDINTINSNIGSRKDAGEYVTEMIQQYIRQAVSDNLSVTLLERVGSVRAEWMSGNPLTDMKLLTGNFRTIEKFSQKSRGDIQRFYNALNKDIDHINNGYDGTPLGRMANDRYWVLIGGWEGYMQTILSSIWMNRVSKSSIFDSAWIRFQFFTPNKDVPMRKDKHNAILVPLSIFALALQGLVMFGLKNAPEDSR